MNIDRQSLIGLVLMASTAVFAPAQTITSAHSGTVHYFEGDVSIEGQALQPSHARFPEVKEQEVLRSGQGRAEVLLTPGVFLRLGENSAVRMLDNRLLSTRVEVIAGNVMVESEDPQMSLKDSPVTLVYGSYQVRLVKHGLVEISTDPSEMKVFKGEAEVFSTDNRTFVKEGRLMPFTGALLAEKFDTKNADDLYLWARDRSESLSAANMASARSISSSYSESGSGAWRGGWYYNPYMSMFTYVPAAGTLSSPFGFGFFSPAAIYGYYSPVYSFYGGSAPRTVSSVGGLASPVRSASIASPVSGSQLGSPIRSGASAPVGGFGGGARAGLGGGSVRTGGRAR